MGNGVRAGAGTAGEAEAAGEREAWATAGEEGGPAEESARAARAVLRLGAVLGAPAGKPHAPDVASSSRWARSAPHRLASSCRAAASGLISTGEGVASASKLVRA